MRKITRKNIVCFTTVSVVYDNAESHSALIINTARDRHNLINLLLAYYGAATE